MDKIKKTAKAFSFFVLFWVITSALLSMVRYNASYSNGSACELTTPFDYIFYTDLFCK